MLREGEKRERGVVRMGEGKGRTVKERGKGRRKGKGRVGSRG